MRTEKEIRAFRDDLAAEAKWRVQRFMERGVPKEHAVNESVYLDLKYRARLLGWVLGEVEPDTDSLVETLAKRAVEGRV